MSTPTVARPPSSKDAHWYSWEGEPKHTIMGKTTGKPRPTHIGDARKENWVPSVTTILKVLHKEGLQQWLQEQACLAVLTAPRLKIKGKDKDGKEVETEEATDAFVYRVLHTEKQQQEETQIARDKGIEIHEGFEWYFSGQAQLIPPELLAWIQPAIDRIIAFGESATSEMVLVGDGYAGRTDLIQNCEGCWRMWDIKSTKTLPDPAKGGAYPEHRLQLAAYGRSFMDKLLAAGGEHKPLLVGNIYVSSQTPGQFVICEHEDWEGTYEKGFKPLVQHWQWANKYTPVNPVKPRFVMPVPTISQTLDKKLLESLRDPSFLQMCRDAGWLIEREEDAAKRGIVAPQSGVTQGAPAVPTPAAQEVIGVPRLNPGAISTNTNLPTHTKDGKKISWSTGVVAPSNGQPK